ncbi:hypothetical protein V2H21_01065 [Riemerella anatipestifer]|uniref:hypothetical protein n=1 Tax=Riemerella anatipestifer TaxID=34085 RepID=UPI002ECEA44B|nr:hypothetical protein [Riemerella anatipestifer]
MTIAELSMPSLRLSSDEARERFAYRLIYFINPKFEDADEENPHSEFNLAKNTAIDFSRRCDLTEGEFMLALDLCHRGELFLNDTPVKLFREIDRLKLGEVEQAYKAYKNQNKQHEIAKEKVKKFLNPPKELTEEEKRRERFKFLENQWQMLKEKGKVSGSVIFYELIKKDLKVINIGFVEKVLQTFKPELASAEKKIIKQDVFLYFKERFLDAVIKKEKLNELTKEEWVKYWENKKQQQPKN